MKSSKMLKNLIITFSVPLIVYAIFQGICSIYKLPYINSNNFRTFVLNTFYVAYIGWGLYFNVPAGRFDFSVGAVILLSTIIGGNLALMLGLNGTGLLMSCMLAGAVIGAVSGLAYVILRLPAMVVSLGLVLIYEALSFVLFEGRGIVIIGRQDLLYIVQAPYLYIVGFIVMIALIVLINYTKFGYDMRALANDQRISVNTGINEITNTILCYIFSGTVVAVAGVLTLGRTGAMRANLSMATVTTMFQGFLPFFIGNVLSRYSEPIFSIFIGAITTSLIASGLAALGLSLAVQNIINAFIMLGFLAYDINQYKLEELILIRRQKKEALMEQ